MQHDNQDRTSWDYVWVHTARALATRSVDPRYKVGSIIVTADNTQVLAVGYNGDYKGGPNMIESTEPGQSGFIHAEVNCLIKCDFNNHKEKKMYVTLSPCRMCAKAIINGGISEVIYDEEYRDASGIELLKSVGIKVRKFER
jgi:dCMP deaminase